MDYSSYEEHMAGYGIFNFANAFVIFHNKEKVMEVETEQAAHEWIREEEEKI